MDGASGLWIEDPRSIFLSSRRGRDGVSAQIASERNRYSASLIECSMVSVDSPAQAGPAWPVQNRAGIEGVALGIDGSGGSLWSGWNGTEFGHDTWEALACA